MNRPSHPFWTLAYSVAAFGGGIGFGAALRATGIHAVIVAVVLVLLVVVWMVCLALKSDSKGVE